MLLAITQMTYWSSQRTVVIRITWLLNCGPQGKGAVLKSQADKRISDQARRWWWRLQDRPTEKSYRIPKPQDNEMTSNFSSQA